MKTYFAFLRGINVGGHNKIAMQELRHLLSDIGFKDVKTYIQTGNIVFKSLETDKKLLVSKIEQSILEHFDFSIPAIVKTPVEIDIILEKCPFNEEEKQASYFVLLYKTPNQEQIASLSAYEFPNEKFKLINDCVYLHSTTGYGRAKANNNFFEKKLNNIATTRNYKTLKKVIDLSKL